MACHGEHVDAVQAETFAHLVGQGETLGGVRVLRPQVDHLQGDRHTRSLLHHAQPDGGDTHLLRDLRRGLRGPPDSRVPIRRPRQQLGPTPHLNSCRGAGRCWDRRGRPVRNLREHRPGRANHPVRSAPPPGTGCERRVMRATIIAIEHALSA
ncbi:Uncharacterised protein [Streptococcus pneumoniae]|nr:Uncharacterised protein [Streptococcus pneumoniae]